MHTIVCFLSESFVVSKICFTNLFNELIVDTLLNIENISRICSLCVIYQSIILIETNFIFMFSISLSLLYREAFYYT